MLRKWFKRIIITVIVAIPIVPVLVLIDYSQSGGAIFTSGSSSMLPLMQKFSKEYSGSQIIPTGGGSGKGIQDAAQGNTDFGAMSSNEKPSIIGNPKLHSLWVKNQTKTITVAEDAIAIALHIPSNITHYLSKTPKGSSISYPIVRPWSIAKIYSKDAGKIKWSDLLEGAKGPGRNDIVQGYGRNGGKAASGTSDGFFHVLKKFSSYAKPVISLDENHISPLIKKTPEANAQAYSVLNSSRATGITYLSLGYLEDILKSKSSANNIKAGFIDDNSGNTHEHAAGPSSAGGKKWLAPTIVNAKSGKYGWKRMFNLSYSYNNYKHHNYISAFVKWILDPKSKSQIIIKEMNLVQLTVPILNLEIKYIKMNDDQLSNGTKSQQNYGYGYQGH